MDLLIRINIYIFPVLIFSIILLSINRNPIQTTETNIFKKVIISELATMILELVTWLYDGRTGDLDLSILWSTNLLYFILAPLATYFWMNFASYIAFERTVYEYDKVMRYICMVPILIYSIIVLSSPFTGFIFSINSTGNYERGILHISGYIVIFLYMFISIFFFASAIIKEQLLEKKKQCNFLIALTILTLFSSIIQEFFKSLLITYPIISLLILLIYLNIQNRQITTDALTGINNRGFFEKYIKNIFDQADIKNDWYLFILDIDNFKNINDTLGHTSGDNALRDTGNILQTIFSTDDSVVARYGGDEFAVIVHNCNEEIARQILNKINKALKDYNSTNTYFNITISAGYSRSCDCTSIKELIAVADKMMYNVKKEKKGL